MSVNTIKIEEKIQTALIGTIFDIGSVKKTLEKVLNKPAKWVDSKISDGADEDDTENEYIMLDTFECGDYYIRVCYGDGNREIGYVSSVQKR